MKQIYIDDLREEFVRDYVFPMFRANAVYGGPKPSTLTITLTIQSYPLPLTPNP